MAYFNCPDHRENPNLKRSYVKGALAVCMTGLTQEYFAPFLLLLGGTAQHVGILNAVSNLTGCLSQLVSAPLSLKLRSRKAVISLFTFWQAIVLLPMVALSIWVIPSVYFFIIIVAAFTGLGAITNPCWVSLLSDLVKPTRRGSYFGWRGRNLGLTTVAMSFLGGLILHAMEVVNVYWGFAILFVVAFIMRILSWAFLKRVEEPHMKFNPEDHFTLGEFFRRYKESNFVKYVLFVGLMNFSVNLAAPFFSVFMLQGLHFNYLTFTIVNSAAPVVLYLTIRRWGRHADVIGNLKVIKFIAPLFGLIPILWIINQNIFFLVAAEAFAGFLWAGFNLCTSNFIMDAVTPEKRTRCYSYFVLVNGIALFSGAMIGGALLHVLPPLNGHKILSLFLVSAVMRILVGLIFPGKLKEVRNVPSIKSQELLFSMVGVKPMAGIDQKGMQS